MRLFWERGYEGTSISDLLEGMGLTKSSLYKAFESKESLFRRVLKRYNRDYLGFRADALAAPTPRRIAERLLLGMTLLHTGKTTPAGCLVTNAALACSRESEPIRLALAREREDFRCLLRDRFEATSATGPLPIGMSAETAASLVQALVEGLAVQAKAGVPHRQLEDVVAAFLASWPPDEPGAPE